MEVPEHAQWVDVAERDILSLIVIRLLGKDASCLWQQVQLQQLL